MGKIKYRPVRGLLEDSMKEVHEFDTLQEMKEYIYKQEHEGWDHGELFSIDQIIIEDPDGDDNRIGWKNVRYVRTARYGEDKGGCIGFCGE